MPRYSRTADEAFLDAIEPCGHPRDVIGGKKKKTLACNRAGCWLRTCNVYGMLKALFDDADDGVVSAIPGGVKDAGRAALYMRLEEIANQYGVGTDVYQNLFGEGTDTSAPGFYEGGKGPPSRGWSSACRARAMRACARQASRRCRAPPTRPAALCGFKVSQLPSHHPSSPSTSHWFSCLFNNQGRVAEPPLVPARREVPRCLRALCTEPPTLLTTSTRRRPRQCRLARAAAAGWRPRRRENVIKICDDDLSALPSVPIYITCTAGARVHLQLGLTGSPKCWSAAPSCCRRRW